MKNSIRWLVSPPSIFLGVNFIQNHIMHFIVPITLCRKILSQNVSKIIFCIYSVDCNSSIGTDYFSNKMTWLIYILYFLQTVNQVEQQCSKGQIDHHQKLKQGLITANPIILSSYQRTFKYSQHNLIAINSLPNERISQMFVSKKTNKGVHHHLYPNQKPRS